jgi:LCP family protein required for cell wall assembly
MTDRATSTFSGYGASMPNDGYPREPGNSDEAGQRPPYDWLYDESGRPRPTARRSRSRSGPPPGGPNDPTQALRSPRAQPPRAYPGDQPPAAYPPGGGQARQGYSGDPYGQGGHGQGGHGQGGHGQGGHGQSGYGQGGYGQGTYARERGYGQPDQGYGDYEGPPGRSPLRPPDGRGAPRAPRRRRKIRWLRIVLLVLLAYLVILVGVPVLSWSRVEKVPFAPSGERPTGGAGTNYLVVGSDSREGLSSEERDRLNTGGAGGRRTDTIMLLHVPSLGGPPTLISLPRDSYVPIPGNGQNKINAAFAFGGPKLLAATVENVTGLRVDGYIEIGFGGFVGVVESLNGVEMCLPKAVKDEKAKIDLPAGCQELDGPDALGYVRARYFDPLGDLGRVERQRQFMSAVMKETLTPGTVLNPITYTRVGLAYGDALTVGDTTGIFDTARFALAMRAVSSGDGVTMTVPIADPGFSTPVGSAVKWDREKALALFNALRDGEPIPPSLLPKPTKSPRGS